MQKRATKDWIIKKFGMDCGCEVTYKGGRQVKYKNLRHVNWDNVHKIRLDIPPKRFNIGGDTVTRDGASYLLK